MAGVNSCFAEVTENDIVRMQDITIPNDTKKAKKLGIIVLRDKQCFNTQFAHMSSVFCPDRQASLMPLSLNNNCPSTLQFKVPSKSTQLTLRKMSPFKKIWVPLSLFEMIVISKIFQHSNSKHMAWFPEETSQIVLSVSISSKLQLPSRNYFKVLITLTTILSGKL